MAKININNIENVEGKYHLMFFEGKSMVDNAKNDLRYAWFSLLFFVCLLLIFVIVSGFNLFYVGFAGVFIIFFVAILIYLRSERKKGVKQCVYAVQNSKTSDIVAKQVDNRKASKLFVKSLSNTVDKYDAKQKYPSFMQKLKRKRKHDHLVGIITEFERDNKKEA